MTESDAETSEMFTQPPPASPNPRRRGAHEGGSAYATTPARPSKAPALVRTHSLPAGFDMDTINMGATDASVSVLTGKDLAQGILTTGNAIV